MLAALVATAGVTTRPRTAVAAGPASRGAAPAAGAPAATYYSSAWVAAHGSPNLGLHARAAVVVDLDSHTVLWEHESRTPRAPASLTKLMTVAVALDHASLDRQLVVPDGATGMEPNLMGLAAGEVVTVRELLFGIFLLSGNDAAETLAQAIIPRDRFLAEMNARAASWGLRATHFENPSGLDAGGQQASPQDLAVITGHLLAEHPEVAPIAATREQFIPAGPHHRAYGTYNLNKLLSTYPGATGLKTGFTDDAGGCVVATATRDGRHLVAVVMGSDVFFTDAARLLDYGFATAPSPAR